MVAVAPTMLVNLPDIVLHGIFEFIDSPRDRLSYSSTCSRLRTMFWPFVEKQVRDAKHLQDTARLIFEEHSVGQIMFNLISTPQPNCTIADLTEFPRSFPVFLHVKWLSVKLAMTSPHTMLSSRLGMLRNFFPAITRLAITFPGRTNLGVAPEPWPLLEHFAFDDSNIPADSGQFVNGMLHECSRLRSLRVPGEGWIPKWNHVGYGRLEGVLTGLQTLDLGLARCKDATFAQLAACKALKTLSLRLFMQDGQPNHRVFHAIQEMMSLEHLNVSFTGDYVRFCSQLQNANVKWLSLAFQHACGSDIFVDVSTAFPNLLMLSVTMRSSQRTERQLDLSVMQPVMTSGLQQVTLTGAWVVLPADVPNVASHPMAAAWDPHVMDSLQRLELVDCVMAEDVEQSVSSIRCEVVRRGCRQLDPVVDKKHCVLS